MAMKKETYDVDASINLENEMYGGDTSGKSSKSSSQKTNNKEGKTNQSGQSTNSIN